MSPSNEGPTVKRRACVTCTSAKSKCTPQSDTHCERCARLGKQCQYLTMPGRRRKPRDTRRVDELAAKVESLMSQLTASKSHNGAASRSPVASTSAINPPPLRDMSDLHMRDTSQLLEEADDDLHGPIPVPISSSERLPDIVDRGLLELEEADVLIHSFQTNLVPKFPFVVPGSRQTAAILKQQDPFLFLCIVAAAMSNGHPLWQIITDEIMGQITTRIIAGSERNLDLLRGLLVQSAWYRQPAQRGHTQLVLLVQLCVTMVYDLSLDRKHDLTLDERRSLLGAYWLSIGLSRISNRPIAMRHTYRIDESCDILSHSPEHLSDKLARLFVLLNSFLSKTEESYEVLKDPHRSFCGEPFVKIVIGPILRQFESLKASTEQAMKSCRQETGNVLLCDVHFIEMCIRDVAFDDGFWVYPGTPSPSTTIRPAEVSSIRVSMLWDILKHSKALISAFMAIPDAELPYVGVFTLARLCAALALLPKAVCALLKITVSQGIGEHGLSSAQRSEAQTIIDEGEYLSLVTPLLKKFDVMLRDLTGPEREIHVVGSLCARERLLAHCYAPQIKRILGVDLVNSSPVAPVPWEGTAAETLVMGQPELTEDWASLDSQQVWPLSYLGLAESTFPFDGTHWGPVPEAFSNFG